MLPFWDELWTKNDKHPIIQKIMEFYNKIATKGLIERWGMEEDAEKDSLLQNNTQECKPYV